MSRSLLALLSVTSFSCVGSAVAETPITILVESPDLRSPVLRQGPEAGLGLDGRVLAGLNRLSAQQLKVLSTLGRPDNSGDKPQFADDANSSAGFEVDAARRVKAAVAASLVVLDTRIRSAWDGWLMALIALGLIAYQLRRNQKALRRPLTIT